MKKIFFSLLFLDFCLFAGAQTLEISSKPYGPKYFMTVIKPTVNNFITLLSLNESQFEILMDRYKYERLDGGGRYLSFWNGNVDNFAFAKCVNTFSYSEIRDEIRFSVNYDMIYPSDAMTSLFRELRPYFKNETSGDNGYAVDFYAFKMGAFAYCFYIYSSKSSDGTLDYNVTAQKSILSDGKGKQAVSKGENKMREKKNKKTKK
jgi:hypothetical protein